MRLFIGEYQHSPDGIILVGHGGLYRCMLPLVLVNVDVRFVLEHSISNTGCIVAEPRTEGLVCLAWCETAIHLSS
ncbi:histidine phosphatase family protein [Candidatus Poribacteria bacterium]|nr:histidine phosphatase family protein [Candidatus Poribacteria bacterium]